jgi:hypothetical protein
VTGIPLENARKNSYHTNPIYEKRARNRYSRIVKEKMGRKIKSDFLVASPSLQSGAARLFDFYGLYDSYNISPTEAQADAIAVFADWLVVGQDIQGALEQVEELKQRAA